MYSTICGNIIGTAYFIYFQITGVFLSSVLLKKEKLFTKLVIGLATGSLLLMWLPAIFSFFFDFTVLSHIFAAVMVLPVVIFCLRKADISDFSARNAASSAKQNPLMTMLFAATFILWCYLLHTHTIRPTDCAGLYTGQSTYGDMCMHLGFITSIAEQGTFPPYYSLFPKTRLAYPFLNAAISSSIYLWGASLRWAYILPMLTSFIQVMGSVYILADTVLNCRAKNVLTFVFFIFNGGLGFVYFTGIVERCSLRFSDIFSGYYTTPTNLVDFNIRWANVIADIFIPQRASLFGYALLFPCIWLLYKAVWGGKGRYFIYAGIFAAALPMIHTHSFLGIGLISAAWLLLYLHRSCSSNRKWHGAAVLAVFVGIMCVIQQINNRTPLSSAVFMAIGMAGICSCILYGIFLLVRYIKYNGYKKLLSTWGVYLLCAVLPGIPQLLFWTFGQVAEGGFLRGHFNWGNLGDFYPWFYIKNLGIPLIFIVGAICKGSKKISHLILPAAVIWFVAEFIMFTPNTYDNNKLLYIAYLLLCMAASDFSVDLYEKYKTVKVGKIAAVIVVFLSVFSAVLTLGREVVSDYQIFSQPHLEAARYIIENTDAEDVFLTDSRHNNEVAALTGRNIVCGSDIYLYFHGIDTSQRKDDLALMYQQPLENRQLFEKYDVSYVMISSWERGNYNVDENYFEDSFEKVFSKDGVELYKVK
ncbi:MAG: hypothetical protein E7488_02585 [Ruminococcaceae bacterium]|nr:hypothetical protein [Oscillospiraceae bacterium]